MKTEDIYTIVKASVIELAKNNQEIKALDDEMKPEARWADYGFDVFTLGELERDLEERLDGRKLDLEGFLVPETFYDLSVGQVLGYIQKTIVTKHRQPIVVYVDDEEENLFIFRRKFGKDFNIKSFSDPWEALDFINASSDVALVITDEVMPGLRGNNLCDEVRKTKPYMKFILITGNPEDDNGLMYNSLRRGRFYDFIEKPVDFDGKREVYLQMIQSIIDKKVA